MNVEKILIATDFSSSSSVALERGVDLAQQFGAEIHLLHVVPLSELSVLAPLESTWTREELLHVGIDEAEKKIAALEAEIDFGHCSHVTKVTESEFVAEGIVEYADAELHRRDRARHPRPTRSPPTAARQRRRRSRAHRALLGLHVHRRSGRPSLLAPERNLWWPSTSRITRAPDSSSLVIWATSTGAPVRALHVVPSAPLCARVLRAPRPCSSRTCRKCSTPRGRRSKTRSLKAGPFEHGIETEAVIGAAAHEILECAEKQRLEPHRHRQPRLERTQTRPARQRRRPRRPARDLPGADRSSGRSLNC